MRRKNPRSERRQRRVRSKKENKEINDSTTMLPLANITEEVIVMKHDIQSREQEARGKQQEQRGTYILQALQTHNKATIENLIH